MPLPHWSWPNMYLKHLFWPLHFENKNMKTSRHCLGEKTLKTHFSNQVSTVTKDQSGTIFNSSHSRTKKNKFTFFYSIIIHVKWNVTDLHLEESLTAAVSVDGRLQLCVGFHQVKSSKSVQKWPTVSQFLVLFYFFFSSLVPLKKIIIRVCSEVNPVEPAGQWPVTSDQWSPR